VCTLTAGFQGWTLVQTYHVGVSERLDQAGTERETDVEDHEIRQVPQWKAAASHREDER
jgi:hypothetical protein